MNPPKFEKEKLDNFIDSYIDKSGSVQFLDENENRSVIVPKEITDTLFKDLPLAHSALGENGQQIPG